VTRYHHCWGAPEAEMFIFKFLPWPGFEPLTSQFNGRERNQCRLNAWANWAVARGLTTLGGLKINQTINCWVSTHSQSWKFVAMFES